MELAIPLIALGGMYVISNSKNNDTSKNAYNEGYTNKKRRTLTTWEESQIIYQILKQRLKIIQ